MSDVVDWNTELRKIEREFDGLPPEPTAAEVRKARLAAQRADQRQRERKTMWGIYARLALVMALAGAVVLWPYRHACGPGLLAFMGAEGMIVTGGLWLMVCTWRARMAKTHGAALVLLLWGLMLIGHQVLPRIGYAKTDPVNLPQWRCESPR